MCMARARDCLCCAVQGNRALVRRVVPHHALDQGALACTVLTEQRVKRTGLDVQRNVIEGDHRPEPLGHTLYLQTRHHHAIQSAQSLLAKLDATGAVPRTVKRPALLTLTCASARVMRRMCAREPRIRRSSHR